MFENKNEKLKEEIELLQSKLRAVSNIFSQYDVRGYEITAENINRILPGFKAKVDGIIKDEVTKHPGEMFGDNLKNEMKLQLGNQVTSFILNSRAQLAQMVEKYKEEEAKGNNSPMKTLFGGSRLKMKKVSKKRQEEILKNIIKRSAIKRKTKKGGFCGATFSPFVPPTAGTATSVATLTWAKPSPPSTSTVSKTASANLGKMSNADLNDAANTALKASQTGGKSDKVVREVVKKIRKQKVGGICSATFAPFEVNPIANAWKIGASCKTVSAQTGGKRGSVSKQVVKEIISRIKSQKGGEALAPFVKYYPGEVVSFLDRGSSGRPIDMSNTHSAWSMGKTACKSTTQNGGKSRSSLSKKKKVVKRKKQRGGCSDLAPFTSTSKSASLVKPAAQTGGKKFGSKKSGSNKSKMSKCETGMKKKIIKIRKKIVIIGDSSSSDSDFD